MTYSSEVLADSPGRYWHLDTSSGNALDSSPNNVAGAIINTPTYSVAAVVGTGIEFGAVNAYGQFSVSGGGITLTTAVTIEVWWKYQGGTIIWRDQSSSGGWLALISGANLTVRIDGVDRSIAGAGTTLLSAGPRGDGWHHFVVTSSGTSVVTYIDGVAVDTWARTANVSTWSGGVIYFGRNGSLVAYQHASWDECAFYTSVLSAARVLAHYNQTRPPDAPTSVAMTAQTTTSLTLSWSAPSTGGPVTSYEVRIDGGTPATATSPHVFTGLSPGVSYTLEVRAVGPIGVSSWVSVSSSTPADPPNVPTSVTASANLTDATLSWSAPTGGGPVTSYQVRVDGGTPVGATSPHLFTGLSHSTSYTLEVRAVGPGGSSSWVSAGVTTLTQPAGYYRVELALGAHSWDVTYLDPAAFGPTLPLSLGWDIADGVDFFPAQADMTTLTFALRVTDAADVADVVKGTTVTMRLYVSAETDAEPWQTFTGIVTQLEGETVPSVAPGADENTRDFRLTVYAADDNARLAGMFVGYGGGDWPIEHISDRLDRICAEAGISRENGTGGGPHGLGKVGWLPARPEGAPLSVLNAIQQTLRDAADDYDSEPPDHYYGRYVFDYNHEATDDLDAATLYIHVFRRRMYGSSSTVDLDGGLVHARGARWTKQPGPSQASFVIVDGVTFGTPSGVPFVRNTGLLDYFGDPPGSDTNYSATERDNLGESLLPDGSTALDGWAARTLRYAAYVDPAPVALWASWAPPTIPIAVVIAPIAEELRVNDEDYLAGTLTGARLVLAPGGRFYVDIRLRAELLPGTELP